MSDKKTISFVLGIYNAERTLRECLDGIFQQDLNKKDYEVIIVDGGSTDKTLTIISEYQKTYKNIKLIPNPHKLSEGKGMGKDQGISIAKGKYVILLDHDNILIEKNWTKEIIYPMEKDKNIMASQSLLESKKGDTLFLHYVNALGVEDPFAVPYSLVSQVVLNPQKFEFIEKRYFLHKLSPNKVLFGGANGCAFRREVFKIIGGYTRDVDVFAEMASNKMPVAIPNTVHVYHKTASKLSSFLIKKGVYYYRFIKFDTGWKKYRWAGNSLSDNIRFYLLIMNNLGVIGPFILSLKQFIKTREFFWFLHAPLTFFITLEYILITALHMKNFFSYIKKS